MFSVVRPCACRRHACCRRRGAREEPGQRLPAHFAAKTAEQEERFKSDSHVSDSQCSAVLLLLQQLPIYISTGCPPLIPPSRNDIASQHLSYHFFAPQAAPFPLLTTTWSTSCSAPSTPPHLYNCIRSFIVTQRSQVHHHTRRALCADQGQSSRKTRPPQAGAGRKCWRQRFSGCHEPNRAYFIRHR
jgi:hypothetical protein